MNYKQIKEIEAGTWFEVLEDYVYETELLPPQTIPKGTNIQAAHVSLKGWSFRFDKPLPGFSGMEYGLGRARLLKMKLKEVQSMEKPDKEVKLLSKVEVKEMSRKDKFLEEYGELCRRYRLRIAPDHFYSLALDNIRNEKDEEFLSEVIENLRKFSVGE